jgi:hypothetical protein
MKISVRISRSVILIFLSLCSLVKAQSTGSFQSLDNYVRKCPVSATQTITSLADYLQKACKTDMQKARAIYVWITDNINYDKVAYNSGKYNDCSAEGVLRSRKSVCEGFSSLFLSLGLKMNLEIRQLSGYAKGYSYTTGNNTFNQPNHSWNIIKINGKWRLFDVTWGQGFGYTDNNGKLACVKEYSEFWFNTDPYAFIFTHFPTDSTCTLIDSPIGLNEFCKLPYLQPDDFQHGITAKEIFQFSLNNKDDSFPVFYTSGLKNIKVIKIPLSKTLEKGKKYHFEFSFPNGKNMFFVDSLYNKIRFKKYENVFSLDYIPALSGEVTINAERIKHEGVQIGFMKYTVK